jgi:hypothetical protein
VVDSLVMARLVLRRARVAGVVALWTLAALAPATSAQTPESSPTSEEWLHTVRPGDTLWALSREYLESTSFWPRLQRLNRIADPSRLAPGTRLRIPLSWMKTQPAGASVIETRGRVDVVRAGSSDGTPLLPGDTVRSGHIVTTGSDGSVAFEFADGSRHLLGTNGRVVFDGVRIFGTTGMADTHLRIERGRTRSQVTPRRGRFRIWTPAAATVVRGTEFRAEFEAESRVARTEVTSGTVDTSGASITVRLEEAFGTATAEGAPPAPPVPLLPAPSLGSEPLLVERLPLRVAVPVVPGAVAYHLEVAPDQRFLALAYEGTSATGEFRTGDLPDGSYAFRLRAVDEQGLQGLDATSTLIVDARPEPPVLIDPPTGAQLMAERPRFAWSAPVGATGYHFQLGREESPDPPLVDEQPVTEPSFTAVPPLQPGRYVWRVATRAADGDQGPFSDWQTFTRRLPPPTPQPAPPQAEGGRVNLAWPMGGERSTYRLQVARDLAFTDLLVDEVTPNPAWTLEQPPPGTYHLRVKTIEPDGFEGDFGTPQSFEVTAPPRKRRVPWGRILAPIVTVVVFVLAT